MGIPSKVVGGGNNSVAQNVFKVTFSEATDDVPRLEAWDDYTFASVLHEIFTGTAGNSTLPMIGAIATTDAVPGSDWMPASASAGGAVSNLLEGSTSYVDLAVAAVAQGGNVRFNLNWNIPYDAAIPSDMASVFVIRFSYTGAAPVLTWEFNDDEAGGIEATPVWTTITPGLGGNKVKPADAGSTAGNVILHRPVSGTIDAPEIWITAS